MFHKHEPLWVLRLKAFSQFEGFSNRADSYDVSTYTHGGVVLLSSIVNVCESFDHHLFLSVNNFFFGPEVSVEVLYPFEVGNSYAAAVSENVRNNFDASLMEDDISFIIGRAVSSFDDHLSFDLVSVLFSDLEFQSSRNQNINILEKNFVAADSGSTRIAFDQAVMSFGIFFNFVRIQAVGIIDTAGDIGQGNNLQAFIGCAFSSPGTNVAEALDSDGCGVSAVPA